MSATWNLFSCGLRTGLRQNVVLNAPRQHKFTPLQMQTKAFFSSSTLHIPVSISRPQHPMISNVTRLRRSLTWKFAGITSLGLGLTWFSSPTISYERMFHRVSSSRLAMPIDNFHSTPWYPTRFKYSAYSRRIASTPSRISAEAVRVDIWHGLWYLRWSICQERSQGFSLRSWRRLCSAAGEFD